MSDKLKDPDQYDYEIREWKRKLNMMSEQVKVYEKNVEAKAGIIAVLEGKLASAAIDNANIRTIMTNNITESNARQQSLLEENRKLQQKIRDLS